MEEHHQQSSNQIRRAIPLSVTTRGIGIVVCAMYREAIMQCPDIELSSIYSCYRTSLQLLEAKLSNTIPYPFPSFDIWDCIYQYSSEHLHYLRLVPEPLKNLLDSIGVINYYDKTFFPVMPKDAVINGIFVPRPENIIFSNLRKTVEALSSADTPLEYRKKFYDNNTIPATIWDTNKFLLLNPDEIMPKDCRQNFGCFTQIFGHYKLSKYSKMFKEFKELEVSQKGKRSLFVSNEMCDLRVCDRKPDESLDSYYRHCSILSGDIESYTSNIKLSKNQIHMGSVNLLGEKPAYEEFSNMNIFSFYSLIEESKLSIAQRSKDALVLHQKKDAKDKTKQIAARQHVRPRTSRRRSLSAIRSSGVFELDQYKPTKRGEDREKMKEQLANTMAFGDSVQQTQPRPPRAAPPAAREALPTTEQRWNELVTQIRERAEWLAEMEHLGEADAHRETIQDQIAQRMRALDALALDSARSSARSTASGFSTKPAPTITASGAASCIKSGRVGTVQKFQSSAGASPKDKEENVLSYGQFTPLQYSPRRRV